MACLNEIWATHIIGIKSIAVNNQQKCIHISKNQSTAQAELSFHFLNNHHIKLIVKSTYLTRGLHTVKKKSGKKANKT